MSSTDRARRLEGGRTGYWFALDAPLAIERIGSLGYDYLVLDAQHGEFTSAALTRGLQAAAVAGATTLVRVSDNSPFAVSQALDRGADGVIVPLIASVEDARRAVEAARFPPRGVRSYGPLRTDRQRTSTLAQIDEETMCVLMIETVGAVRSLRDICAVPGVSAVYVGPSDLRIGLGGDRHDDPELHDRFEETLVEARRIAQGEGMPIGIHIPSGSAARERLDEGFDFVSIASDVNHLVASAAGHLTTARSAAACQPGESADSSSI